MLNMGGSFGQATQNTGAIHFRCPGDLQPVSNAVPTAIGALKYICRKNAGNPLTSRANAIVTINKFRPVFTRVVLGNNIRKLSSESYLALEVGSIVVLGSEGENVFGSPRSVEENDKVKLWVTDMRKPGGNG